MEPMTSNPEKFATWFNMKFPGAYRSITKDDIIDLTECGLIHRYGHFSLSQDLETIRAILQYEKLWEKRSERESAEDKLEPPKCKKCKQPLPPKFEGKKGRPKEYCHSCESSRNAERYRSWRKRKKRLLVESTSGLIV